MVLLFVFVLAISACRELNLDPPGTAVPPPTETMRAPDTTTPSKTPLPTATQTMREALDPYTVAGLREHKFRSGLISVGPVLLETDNFTRYPISYPSDGLTITGILQVPVGGTGPYPVIVMNHGFFSRSAYRSGDGTDRAAEFLNRRGYLTLSSDYRSWGDSDIGESLFYSGLAIDVENLINAIPSIPEADAGHIGMWGHSMGGGVTLKVLTIDSRIKAAVLYSTVSGDFEDIIARWGPGCLGDIAQGELEPGCNSSDILPLDLPDDLISAYFNSAADAEILNSVSPIDQLEFITSPVQIVFGTRDGLTLAGTPPDWSKKLYTSFMDAGKEAQIFAHEGEGHSFIGDPWFVFMARSSQFFDKYVRP